MENIAAFNHKLFVKLPLGIQSLLKSLPCTDFSILIIVLGTVLLLIILILNIYHQVQIEIQLQDPVTIPQKIQTVIVSPNITQRRKRSHIKKIN